MKDSLGNRMKNFYESRNKSFLPRKSYIIIRIDGKAFHTYTKNLSRPFDDGFMEDMDNTAIYLCKNIMGAKFAFVQSDEISILLTDFEKINTEAWFDNNIQKMCSVSASMATSKFNQLRTRRKLLTDIVEVEKLADLDKEYNKNCSVGELNIKKSLSIKEMINRFNDCSLAEFDSRVFQIPQKNEVENYFIWRQQDTTRNSILSVAHSLYNQKELSGKNTKLLQDLIFEKGINWDNYEAKYKRGRIIVKENYQELNSDKINRSRWISVAPPIFTQNKEFLQNIIPNS